MHEHDVNALPECAMKHFPWASLALSEDELIDVYRSYDE